MKISMSTFCNGDCTVIRREDGALACRGYGLVLIEGHLVHLDKLSEIYRDQYASPDFGEQFWAMKQMLNCVSKRGGVPYPGAQHWESNFTARYEGEDAAGGIAYIPACDLAEILAKLDVNQPIVKAARFACSPEGHKSGSGAMGQLKTAVAAYNEAKASE